MNTNKTCFDQSTTIDGINDAENLENSILKINNNEIGTSDDNESIADFGIHKLSDEEIDNVELSFKGLNSEIYVCDSIINLFKTKCINNKITGCNDSNNNNNNNNNNIKWEYVISAVPLLILDYGLSKARTKRCIKLILAERGSCFTLFQDIINHLSNYKFLQNTFQTFHLSSDHSVLMGIEFYDEDSASQFYSKVEQLISAPENVSLSIPGNKLKQKSKIKYNSLPKKNTISQPCHFKHLISVDKTDDYFSLQQYVQSRL